MNAKSLANLVLENENLKQENDNNKNKNIKQNIKFNNLNNEN